MPIFDYDCPNCGREERDVFIMRNSFNRKCLSCGSMMNRLPPIVYAKFEGTDWTPRFYPQTK